MSIFSYASLCYYINLKFFTHQDNICYIENVLREGWVLSEPKEIINSKVLAGKSYKPENMGEAINFALAPTELWLCSLILRAPDLE